jgi:serine/threonine protein kinase
MDLRYEAYCFADPLFFDEQRDAGVPGGSFAQDLPAPPDGWLRADQDVWRMLAPADLSLPRQGWKIHVSAHLDNAVRVLAAVHAYCTEHRIAFKHLRTRTILLTRNSKYAQRESSGKFITIYPADDAQFDRVLRELSEELAGESGPYILSDLRYGQGPLYARYGGFDEQWVEFDGARVLAVSRPDGVLVPDRREPKFYTPDWVELPECLLPQLAARAAGDPGQFPYQITRCLHYSNGGGVYVARHREDGREVVLKEARPHAGLDADGTDAVARLHREHATLCHLAGVPGVPAVYEMFSVWEHEFLAMQYLPGIPLGTWLVRNYPLTRRNRGPAEVEEYTRRAVAVLDDITALVDKVHERGMVFGDLHGQNLLVDEDDTTGTRTVSLVDFEMAASASDIGRPGLGAPGFRSPADRAGFAIDEYALAALRLWLFLPLNSILELAPSKLDGLLEFIEGRFELPTGFGDSVRAQLSPRTAPTGESIVAPVSAPPSVPRALRELSRPDPDWPLVRRSIAEAILASATPARTDRLFPGDIEAFRVGGACFGVGAAGVLYALDAAGFGRHPEHERWLLDSVRRDPPKRPGFFDGAHGIAYVLENFGHHDTATQLLTDTAGLAIQTTDHGLNSGLAGIGLTRLHFAGTREGQQAREFLDQALETGERLAAALAVAPPPGKFGRAGLLHGWSGPAVLFVGLYRHTGERRWLDLADQALAKDLEECGPADDGSLQVRDGNRRTLPYLGIGSAGVAVAAELLAEHAEQPGEFASLGQLPELRRACLGEFTAYSGLMYGRTGLLAALAMGQRNSAAAEDPELREAIGVHLAGLSWHAVPYRDGLAFPGEQLLRLSMDVNTGSAGVLLALAAALDGHGTALPFLEPSRVAASPVPTG